MLLFPIYAHMCFMKPSQVANISNHFDNALTILQTILLKSLYILTIVYLKNFSLQFVFFFTVLSLWIFWRPVLGGWLKGFSSCSALVKIVKSAVCIEQIYNSEAAASFTLITTGKLLVVLIIKFDPRKWLNKKRLFWKKVKQEKFISII